MFTGEREGRGKDGGGEGGREGGKDGGREQCGVEGGMEGGEGGRKRREGAVWSGGKERGRESNAKMMVRAMRG